MSLNLCELCGYISVVVLIKDTHISVLITILV